jgi:hypothetical protein
MTRGKSVKEYVNVRVCTWRYVDSAVWDALRGLVFFSTHQELLVGALP